MFLYSMAFKKISIHPLNLESRREHLKGLSPTIKDYESILRHLELLARGEVTCKPIGERRQQKIIDDFILFFKNVKKPTAQLTKADMQKFKDDFLNNRIKKEHGNYADDTKEDCTEIIARFLECTYPKKVTSWTSSTGKPFRKWFVIRAEKKTPEVLNEDEVEKLFKSSKTIEGKFLIAVLFDSGARIEE